MTNFDKYFRKILDGDVLAEGIETNQVIPPSIAATDAVANESIGTSKYDIASKLAVEGLDDFTGVMPAAIQKKVFGANLFGGKTLRIDTSNQGKVKVRFKVAFGQDVNVSEFSFEEIADAVNAGRPLRF